MQTTKPTSIAASPARRHGRVTGLTWAWPQVGRTTAVLAACVLVGLGLRLWFLSANVIDPRFSAADDGDYYQRALRLAVTGAYRDDSWLIRPPFHVFVFAAMLRVGIVLGDQASGITLVRLLQIGLSLGAIVVGYDLARRLFNQRAGFVFAAILAVWFPFVELPSLFLSEPLFLYLLLAHLWLLVRWRDSRHWGWLAGAGAMLGMAALTRSPAFYAASFALLFVLLTLWRDRGQRTGNREQGNRHVSGECARTLSLSQGAGHKSKIWRTMVPAVAVFLVAFVAVVGPWTLRNYVVYRQFIVVDTLGPVNLWLSLLDQPGVDAKTTLAGMPQADRQAFVSGEIARIVREDPSQLVRNVWPHFWHIWKAQFVEDFVVKVSFYTRPLRAIWPLGVASDLVWFGFTLASVFALVAPLREGAFRLVALGWISYTVATVLLLHVEPRYLLPLWLLLALYGSWAVAALPVRWGYLRSAHGVAGLALVACFLLLFFSYRNYPQIVTQGTQREWHRFVGAQAYARGDYATAISAFDAAVAVQPEFVDGRTDLARAYLAVGDYDAAWDAVGRRQTHRSDVVRGAISRAQGDDSSARSYFTNAELSAGEDIQALMMAWAAPQPTNTLDVGNDLDFGYVQGFSFSETLPPQADGERTTYRWLQDQGQIVLPLSEPLRVGSVLSLRMTSGQPMTVPLTLRINGTAATLVDVRSGQWRVYRITVPSSLAGAQQLTVALDAPAFIPLQQNPDSTDARSLSLMIDAVAVK